MREKGVKLSSFHALIDAGVCRESKLHSPSLRPQRVNGTKKLKFDPGEGRTCFLIVSNATCTNPTLLGRLTPTYSLASISLDSILNSILLRVLQIFFFLGAMHEKKKVNLYFFASF